MGGGWVISAQLPHAFPSFWRKRQQKVHFLGPFSSKIERHYIHASLPPSQNNSEVALPDKLWILTSHLMQTTPKQHQRRVTLEKRSYSSWGEGMDEMQFSAFLVCAQKYSPSSLSYYGCEQGQKPSPSSIWMNGDCTVRNKWQSRAK